MNAIFSAQKLASHGLSDHLQCFLFYFFLQKITIDVCQLTGSDTVFLQQAAHLTGGSYIFMERRDALLQYLIVSKKESRDLQPYFQGNRWPSFLRHPFGRSCLSLLKIRLTFEQLVFAIRTSLT